MAIISDALRQAFMPKLEYENLRDEDRAWGKIQRPIIVTVASAATLVVVTCVLISLKVVFPGDIGRRPFCGDPRVLPITAKRGSYSDLFPGAFYLTDQETVDYFWMVVFIPSAFVFCFSVVYLLAGMIVAYNAPSRHGCLKVVENNCCASKRGGVRCLSILNIVFAVVFGLFGVFLGSTLLTLGSRCSLPLFWSYEIAAWGMVVLYAGTAFFLRRKAALILDDGECSGRTYGLEMLEDPVVITPQVERLVNEGFKSWMGPSVLSSDDENDEI